MSTQFMICPTCNKQVLAGMATCQFCGSDLRGMAPTQKKSIWVDPDSHDVVHTGGKPKWVVPAYYVIASYFALSGIISLITLLTSKDKGEIFHTILMVMSGIQIVIGLGLIAKIEIIRGIVNFVCGLMLIRSLIGLLGSLGAIMVAGGWGFLILFWNLLDIVTNGLMIYLIGETD